MRVAFLNKNLPYVKKFGKTARHARARADLQQYKKIRGF